MRKKKKEKIISLLASYREAHNIIKNLLNEGKKEEASALMSLCQDGMEKLEEECKKEIANDSERKVFSDSLTAYQKSLFLSYEALLEEEDLKEKESQEMIIGGRKEIGKGNAQKQSLYKLQEAEEIFESLAYKIQKIPIHTLILFLPYKASMWDSMESVYLAAQKDSACEALVMPITYFERNENTEFGEPINEKGIFPANIPTIGEDFSIEEEEPDIIYIHNPYDDTNYVTSVHPRYYSRNLKKYTQSLIFLPYYATMGVCAFEKIFLSVFPHMNYTVVQKEEHKEVLPRDVQEKAIVLGSPKFDRVLSLEKNPPELPAKWQEIARGKKIIYFNSGIEDMLMDTKALLKKMEEVFSLFKNHQYYALLWRPHPLLENTFRIMRKEYLQSYLALKKKFCEEKIGIYDDSAELERAVSLSSAYLGDPKSSLVSLFSVAEKLVIILENTLSYAEQKNKEYCKDFLHSLFLSGKRKSIAYEKEKIKDSALKEQISERKKSKALRAEKGEEAIVYEGRFLLVPQLTEETVFLNKLNITELGLSEAELKQIPADEYGEAYLYQEKWILSPKAGNHFLILEKGKPTKKIYLPGCSCKPNAFSESYRLGDYIFCKSENYPSDIRLSLKTHGIKELKEGITGKEEGESIYAVLSELEREGRLVARFSLKDLISGFLPWRAFSYGLLETTLYSLKDFLEEKPLLCPFDKAVSHDKLKEISVNIGTAGEKIHRYFQDMTLKEK